MPAPAFPRITRLALSVLLLSGVSLAAFMVVRRSEPAAQSTASASGGAYTPRVKVDTSGFAFTVAELPPWSRSDSLGAIGDRWRSIGPEKVREADAALAEPGLGPQEASGILMRKAICLNFMGEAEKAYDTLTRLREVLDQSPSLAQERLYTTVYFQGVTALRLGENENCVECRGMSACILPLNPAAIHQKPRGSRLALQHFEEYLREFPDDLEVRWLLNLAHMTLGEYPAKVNPRYLISLDRFSNSEFNIGEFQDISHLVGLNRINLAGGAIMDDFTNDGKLDLIVTSSDLAQPMAFYRNTGTGAFREISASFGMTGQLGGLNCVQTDYNNDGRLDVFISRGAWLRTPIRPSLLRNNPDGTFTDVTVKAGLQEPVNSNAGIWADYDNDGHLDLFVCCEQQANRLYHNQGNGTFRERAGDAGLLQTNEGFCKGATWIDYDNDDYPDLFVNYQDGTPHLFHNERNGQFSDVTLPMGIDGPTLGFSCWAFDYDNDGWEDLFATCYERSVEDVVHGLLGEPFSLQNSRLYRNVNGKRFEDMTAAAGLDMGFLTMGSNYGDVDNDGFLDMYLGTGDPEFNTLVPNRLFRNVDGARFAEITGTSRTGHLQKGHGVAFGDWDRDGNVDLFIELGGAAPGDRYHNVLFQNPGHTNQWLTLKLVGGKSNRAAIGARIKIITSGNRPRTICRTVSSGSSFGGNPLQQTIGLGRVDGVESLEIRWPASRTTQVFRNLTVNQALQITEGAAVPRKLDWPRLPSPILAVPVARK